MAKLFQDVQPGDLITADLMKSLIREIEKLDEKVKALETSSAISGAVIIRELVPPSGTVRVGEELQVLGQSFGFTMGEHRVYIDDLRVDNFKAGSNDQHLIFDIPLTIIDVPSAGRPAMLTVSNRTSSAQRRLHLLTALKLAGAVDVIPRGVKRGTLTTPTPNEPFTYEFLIVSRANLDATYAIDAAISVAANEADWQRRVQVLDSNERVITTNQIQLDSGAKKTFYVRISQIPPNTERNTFGNEST